MTTHRQKICKDCGTMYHYQSSGFGAPENNDATWCLDCAKIINDARSSIKRKFDWKYVTSDEYTLDELKVIEEATPKPNFFGMTLRRVYVGLFDLKNPSNKNIRGEVVTPKGAFIYSYWTESDSIEIQKKVYYDLELNEPSEFQQRESDV